MVVSLAVSSSTVGVVPPSTPAPAGVRRLRVVLIKPSKYDDEGYVLRFFRGVLPSNTLAVLAGLTRRVAATRALGAVEVELEMRDETVEAIDPPKLARRWARDGGIGGATRTVVALCGVQSNQFPRAADLARQFRAVGLPVLIGGFHVSGAIAMSGGEMPAECQEMLDAGVTLVKGEVEDCWGDLLRDALHGRLLPFYDIVAKPDLDHAPMPVTDPRLRGRFAMPHNGTIDAGRGCPFSCSFCTVINVQGRSMRCRSAEVIRDSVRESSRHGITFYFFTDDNFARNPNWEAILDALIALRDEEKLDVTFMMQVDTQAWKLPGFVAKAAAAGCQQVFIGMETMNPANLPAAGKRQNHVEQYRQMVQVWHDAGIGVHVGYILGFPFDTPESLREDLRKLREEIQVDLASFFMLTPLPGSQDHADLRARGQALDADLNRFDSFHATVQHPRMSTEEWTAAYEDAWRDFYSVANMKAILRRVDRRVYWVLFRAFMWYAHSALVEETHPMVCGFLRLRHRTQRRPGCVIESRPRHAWRQTAETARWLRKVVRLYLQMQDVWLATRRPAPAPPATAAPPAPSGAALVRARLNAYWRQTRARLRHGALLRINPLAVAFNLAREVKLATLFNLSLLSAP